jgi:hypothetical protein
MPNQRSKNSVCNNVCEDSYCDWYDYTNMKCSLRKDLGLTFFDKIILEGSCPRLCPRYNFLKHSEK